MVYKISFWSVIEHHIIDLYTMGIKTAIRWLPYEASEYTST